MDTTKHETHELIQLVRDLAVELGRTPTRNDMEARVINGRRKIDLMGGMSVLLQAAGLETWHERRSSKKLRITNEVFARNLETHLAEYQPRPLKEEEPYRRTVFIPDTHFPFHSQRTLDAIYRFIEKEKPECVVQVGDLYDRYSHARFPRSHNQFTPEQEESMARAGAEEMWKEVQKAAPGAECAQLVGNHDLRPLKQILSSYPAAEKWIERMMEESMTFEGVKTIFDPREEYRLPGGVDVIHGHLGKLGDHRNHSLTNVVHGHTHNGGVVFRQHQGRVLWEMDCGLAGDPESKGLSYTAQKTVKWTLGWGFLDSYGPRFIPLR